MPASSPRDAVASFPRDAARDGGSPWTHMMGWVEKVSRTLHVGDASAPQTAHDVLTAMVLSEAAYRQKSSEIVDLLMLANQQIGWTSSSLAVNDLQFSSEWANQRCVVTESEETLFVCFRGTKVHRDIWTDLNIFLEPVFDGDESLDLSETYPTYNRASGKWGIPCAHRGFVRRARAVPVLWFHKIASKRKMRLVFCGHSLGGSVAAIATIRLMQHLESAGKSASNVVCVSFGTPAMGNLALQKYVKHKKWHSHILNYTLKEDFVPVLMQPQRLISWKSRKSTPEKQQQEANQVQAQSPAEQPQTEALQKGDNGGSKRKPGTNRFYRRVKQLVPLIILTNGRSRDKNGEGTRAASRMYAYVGRQFTVLDTGDDMIVPASSVKRDEIEKYVSKSNESGTEKTASSNWNLIRGVLQSFEAHRMYSYRARILNACKLAQGMDTGDTDDKLDKEGYVSELPSPPPNEDGVITPFRDMSVEAVVLPRMELRFAVVRLYCRSKENKSKQFNIGARVFLAGNNISSCTHFQLMIMDKIADIETRCSSSVDRFRVSKWTQKRFPGDNQSNSKKISSFWLEAFARCEEIFELSCEFASTRSQIGLQPNNKNSNGNSTDSSASEVVSQLVDAPISIRCQSDFQIASTSLVLIPSHIHVFGRHYWQAKLIHGLLSSLLRAPQGTKPQSAANTAPMIANASNVVSPPEVLHYTLMDYSFVSGGLRMVRDMLAARGLGTGHEGAHDITVFVDTIDHWQSKQSGSDSAMPVPYGLRHLLRDDMPSLLVILNNATDAESDSDGGTVLLKAKQAGFSRVHFMSVQTSHDIISNSRLSPFTLYSNMVPSSYQSLIGRLAKNEQLKAEAESIHATLQELICSLTYPTPMLHPKGAAV